VGAEVVAIVALVVVALAVVVTTGAEVLFAGAADVVMPLDVVGTAVELGASELIAICPLMPIG
jgi:diacylglycerol kinase